MSASEAVACFRSPQDDSCALEPCIVNAQPVDDLQCHLSASTAAKLLMSLTPGPLLQFCAIMEGHSQRVHPALLEIDDSIPTNMPMPLHVAEQIAAEMIESGQVRMEVWELLCDCLPSDEPRREASSSRASSMGCCSGAYSQGPLSGLRRNTTLFPWVTLLVCKFIRSCTHVPFTSFVLQRNTSMGVHKDLNNAKDSVNVLLPCLTFPGGGLWIEQSGGHMVKNLTMSGITFNPHHRHETYPWEGHRITVAVYTVREIHSLQPEHRETLQRLQFALLLPSDDRTTVRANLEAEASASAQPHSAPPGH